LYWWEGSRAELARCRSGSSAGPDNLSEKTGRPTGRATISTRGRGLRLAEPRFVPLTREQEREAVALLAELLLDAAARKRRVVVSPGVFGSAFGGATGSVIPFPERRGNAREAA
jgi:hypothetical protein